MLTNLRWLNAEHTCFAGLNEDGQRVSVPVAPGNREYDWIIANSPPVAEYVDPIYVPTSDSVNAERDRRLSVGHSFTVDGIDDPVPLQGRENDQFLLSQLKDAAQDLKAAGQNGAVIRFRDGVNADHVVTPDQMISLVIQGRTWVSMMMAKAWAIKDLDPIPADYADDSHWS